MLMTKQVKFLLQLSNFNFMKPLYFLIITVLFSININAQIVVIDPGHGYGATTSNNPDGRTATEIETALEVGLKTKTLIQNSCIWTAQMTRTTNLNGWISVNQRALMANNWNADRLISIHCNAGGGTGTETFYCTESDTNAAPDIAFSQKTQANMVTNGVWNNRRCVEDNSFIAYHLGVLKYSSATGCLNEIGFVDSGDATKLTNPTWRDQFALAYFNALKSDLNLSCNIIPGAFTLTVTPECNTTTSQIKLTWTASLNATSYDVYRNGTLYASDITTTQFLNTYLISAGTTYTYSVKAKNNNGQTTNSNGNLAVTAIGCPPGTFTITATPDCVSTTSRINLTWTTSTNATSYDIYRNGNLYASDVAGTQFLNTYLITAGTTYTYSMIAKNSNGTIPNSNGTISVKAINCTSGAKTLMTENEIILYPNPAKDQFYININYVLDKNVGIHMYNLSGQEVYTEKFISKEEFLHQVINVNQLQKGIYIIKIIVDNKEYTKKIVLK